MLKERIKEILEFSKSESPYRKANKGWINQDIFLDLSPSPDNLKQTNEAAKVTLFWSPINSLLSNIFTILIISSILVFTSLSLAKGRFNVDLFNTSLIKDEVKAEDKIVLKPSNLEASDSINSDNEKNINTKDLGEINKINSLNDNQDNLDQKKTINEIDKEESKLKETENHQDVLILKNKKSKSNFI